MICNMATVRRSDVAAIGNAKESRTIPVFTFILLSEHMQNELLWAILAASEVNGTGREMTYVPKYIVSTL